MQTEFSHGLHDLHTIWTIHCFKRCLRVYKKHDNVEAAMPEPDADFADGLLIKPIIGKRCIVCGENINISAIKCPKCSSFQDWRRYTDLIPAPLPWIAAVLGVFVALIPYLSSTFHIPDSQIEFSTPAVSGKRSPISATVTNSGDRPAVVTSLDLECGSSVDNSSIELCIVRYNFAGPPEDSILLPGTTKVLKFTLGGPYNQDDNYFINLLHKRDALVGKYAGMSCASNMEVINFHSGVSHIRNTLNCNIFDILYYAGN
jgi:hypothetical protein